MTAGKEDNMQTMDISKIRLDSAAQARAGLSEEILADYCEAF